VNLVCGKTRVKVILCTRETRKLHLNLAKKEKKSELEIARYRWKIGIGINGIVNENPDTGSIKRIVIEWAHRIYVVRRIEMFHGEQELGEEAKTKNRTDKDR
jgi:hypothetical protein